MIIIVGIAAVLFLLALITKRRFGMLGLALCAGALLSQTTGNDLAGLIEKNELTVQPLTSQALASLLLTLLPSSLLLLSGPKYSGKRAAFLGAIGYSLLATLLLLGPLSSSLTFDDTSRDMLQMIANLESSLVAAAVFIAVIDSSFVSRPKSGKEGKEH